MNDIGFNSKIKLIKDMTELDLVNFMKSNGWSHSSNIGKPVKFWHFNKYHEGILLNIQVYYSDNNEYFMADFHCPLDASVVNIKCQICLCETEITRVQNLFVSYAKRIGIVPYSSNYNSNFINRLKNIFC